MSSSPPPQTLPQADSADSVPVDAPAPAWVDPLPFDEAADVGGGDPFSVLLVETWARPDEGVVFERHVRRLNTLAGVREHAVVTAEFDPASEAIAWHGATVRRDGRPIRTASAADLVVTPIDAAAARRAGGSRAAGAQRLEAAWHDLEPGDLIEASFSRISRAPAAGGEPAPFAARVALQGDRPIGTARLVVDCPPGGAPRFQVEPSPLEPGTTTVAGGRERIVWAIDAVPPVVEEPRSPSWYRPAIAVLISTFPDWSAVAAWLVDRWRPALVLTDAVAARAAEIAGSEDEPTETRALRLVDHLQQRLVHYRGPVNAARSAPLPPEQVLDQGGGSSLDLAFLLTVLLHAVEIPARPLLVPRHGNPRLRQDLPSPTAFDHAVVQIRLDGVLHTIDPTAEGQRGALERRALPGFDFGLPLSRDARELVPLEVRTPGRLLLREYFRLAARNRESSLEVTLKASGGQADRLRHEAATEGITRIGEVFTERFLREYAGVRQPEPLEIDDDEQRDVVTWTQTFGIAEFGTRSEDGSSVRFSCSAHAIRDRMARPGAGERWTPMALPFPLDLVEEIVVEAPGARNLDDDAREVDSPFFAYTRALQRLPQGLKIRHHWISKVGEVPPDALDAYRRELDTVLGLLEFHIDVPLLRGFPFRHKPAGPLLGTEEEASTSGAPGSDAPASAAPARVPVKSALAARKTGNIAALKNTGRPQANDLTIDELDSIFARDDREAAIEAPREDSMADRMPGDSAAAGPARPSARTRRRERAEEDDEATPFDATGLTTERARLPGRRSPHASSDAGRRFLNLFGIVGALAVFGILAAVFSGVFEPEKKETVALEAVRTSLDDPDFVAARRSLRAGDFEDARTRLEPLASRLGDHPDFLVARAELLAAEGALQPAADAVSEAIRISPGHVDAYQAAAAIERRAGNLQAAAAALSRAVNLAPEDDDIWRRLAVVLREGGRLEGAEEAVLRANSIDPDKLENIVELARFRFVQQSPLLARKVFEDALGRREDGDANLHLAFARFLLDTEQGADAVLQAEKALGIDTFNPAVLRAVAAVYDQTGRAESATRLRHQAESLERRSGRPGEELAPPPPVSSDLPAPPPVTSDDPQ